MSAAQFEYQYNVPQDCLALRTVLTMDVVSPAYANIDWLVLPPEPQVKLKRNVYDHVVDIKVLWEREPKQAERNQWYSAARARPEEGHVDAAPFAYAAANRGSDYEYTALAANDLITAGKEAEILVLFDDKDLNRLPIGDNTRFRLTMRKANAARAAGLRGGPESGGFFSLAMGSYKNALEIYPENRQALSLAYATMFDATDARDSGDLTNVFEVHGGPETTLRGRIRCYRCGPEGRTRTQ